MRIEQVPVVACEDIFTEFETSVASYAFLDLVDNDSYVYLQLDEDFVETLEEEIAWEREHGTEIWLNKRINDLTLVNYFRSLGYDDCILVYVCDKGEN